jgi:soluble cytochrome b562
MASSRKSGKKWVTAIDAAQKTLAKTGDIEAAKKTLRKQALTNARKLFGSVSSAM